MERASKAFHSGNRREFSLASAVRTNDELRAHNVALIQFAHAKAAPPRPSGMVTVFEYCQIV